MEKEIYDLIIVGAGPAGLTAAIYAQRYLLDTLVIGELQGGMMSESHKICNFPTQNNISGLQLTQKLINHVKELKGEIKQERVKEIKKEDKKFIVETDKNEYFSKKIILAVGTEKRKLNVPGEEKFLGKGVSYCATCDAGFFRDRVVGVVGGSDAALTAALLLAEYAKKVYIIYRKNKFFRAEPAWVKQVDKNKEIEKIFSSNIKEISGKEKVEKVKLDSGKELKLDGVFVEIGSVPNEEFSEQLGLRTENGYIKVNKEQKTNVDGVYAAGDVTNNPLKQVVTACGEGATAANSAYEEIVKEK